MKIEITSKKLLAMLITMVMMLGTLPVAVHADNPEHTKSGYTCVWAEDFEYGIPENWSLSDEDGDGYNWMWSGEKGDSKTFPTCHGEWCVMSESYVNSTSEALMPDNWIYFPDIMLRKNAEYLLTFMMSAQDNSYFKDKVGVFISTDDGATYNQIGEDYVSTEPRVWEEIEIDLSAYAGKNVKIAMAHHNCTDYYITKLDCFKLWEKDTILTRINSVEANVGQVPIVGETADWTMPTIPDGVDFKIDDYYAWAETDFEVKSYTDLYDFINNQWKTDGVYWNYPDQNMTFKEGKYYTLCIYLTPNDKFEFAPIDEISAKIDGEEADFFDIEMDGLFVLFRTFGPLKSEEPTVGPTAIATEPPIVTETPIATESATATPIATEPTSEPTATPIVTEPTEAPTTIAPTASPDEKPVKAKSIKFKKKSVKLKKGKKITLKVITKNIKRVSFSVDKKGKKIVKLSKKKAKKVVVIAKKKGKAKIIAKAAGKKAICKVIVKKK